MINIYNNVLQQTKTPLSNLCSIFHWHYYTVKLCVAQFSGMQQKVTFHIMQASVCLVSITSKVAQTVDILPGDQRLLDHSRIVPWKDLRHKTQTGKLFFACRQKRTCSQSWSLHNVKKWNDESKLIVTCFSPRNLAARVYWE